MENESIARTELVPDERNVRVMTQRGYGTLERISIEFGGMRSIAIDESNRVLAGNETDDMSIKSTLWINVSIF